LVVYLTCVIGPSDSLGWAERIEVGRNGANDQCNSNSELNQLPGFSAFQQNWYRMLKVQDARRGEGSVVECVVTEVEIDTQHYESSFQNGEGSIARRSRLYWLRM
jgi:hypothetical protein